MTEAEIAAAKAASDKAAAEKAEADKAAADKIEADRIAAEKLKGGGPSEAEAKLLKEVMEKKDALKKATDAADALKAQLKAFEGIDPVAVKKLLQEQKDAETKRLEAAGEFDKVKEQMNAAHAVEVTRLGEETKAAGLENMTLKQQIADLTVGGSFGNSRYITDELALTAAKVRTLYGSHFEFVDGTVTAYDKPAGAKGRAILVDGKGDPLAFELALKKIVEADPDKDTVLKTKLKTGSGSGTGKGKDLGVDPSKVGELTGRQKISAGLKAKADAAK